MCIGRAVREKHKLQSADYTLLQSDVLIHSLEMEAEILQPARAINLHNKCEDKFQSISFCYKSHVEIIDYHHTVGISIANFKKTSFSSDPIKIVVLYRKNSTCLSTFYHTLADILQLDTVLVVLGDFNINAQIRNRQYFATDIRRLSANCTRTNAPWRSNSGSCLY